MRRGTCSVVWQYNLLMELRMCVDALKTERPTEKVSEHGRE